MTVAPAKAGAPAGERRRYSSPHGGPAFAGMTRPKTKWRPASLPASTVPRSVRLARRHGLLSQGGSGRGLAAPVGPSGSFAEPSLVRFRFLRVPILALRPVFGSLAGSFLPKPCGFRIPVPCRTPTKQASSASFRETFGPGASGFAGPSKESGFGFGLRRRLALLPSGCPGPRFDRLPSEDFRRSPRGRDWEGLSVSGRPRPATGRTLAPNRESHQALNRGVGLWITGIVGINLG